MPKLFQINTCIDKSTGRIAQQIGELAISAGWQSYIAFPAREPVSNSKSNLIKIGSKADQCFHALMARIFDCCGFLSRRATFRLINQIELIKPDIVQLHNIHGYYINIPILFNYLKQSNIPVVWTLHDCWAFTGHCVHYTCVDCDRWKTRCFDCPRKKSYPKSLVFDRASNNFIKKRNAYADIPRLNIVAVSKWLGNETRLSILGNYPLQVIQNGIDINVFRPRLDAVGRVRNKYSINGKYVILGVATGWSEEVGLSSFIRLSQVLDKNKYAVVMVGTTDKIDSVLPEEVISIHRINSIDELAEIYSSADILFNGSFQETFGLVTAEAISCGTPVLVYNSTACPEIVSGDTGYVVERDSFDRIVDIIKHDNDLSEDEMNSRRKKCREYAESHFNKNEKYLEYLHLYQSLIA